MESILIACLLFAVALLLLGYRRVAKRGKEGSAHWLFAYRTESQRKQSAPGTARK